MELPFDVVTLLRNRAWEATVGGRYEEALGIYMEELPPLLALHEDEPPRLGDLNNLAILHLLMGDLDRALALFRQGRDLPAPPAIPQPFVGCVLWIRGEQDAACEDWAYELRRRRSGVITHCDEAGGVEAPALLWWASAHMGLEQWRRTAELELKRRGRTKQCQRSSWPGSLAPFLLGQGAADCMNEEQLIEIIGETEYPSMNFERRCLAHFYLGAACLARGDVQCYQEHLERVLTPLPAGLRESRLFAPEYHLTRAELGVAA